MAPKLARDPGDQFTVVDEDAMAPPEHPSKEGFIEVRNSGKAIAALVLGIATYMLAVGGFITAILAIIFGAMARKEIRAHPASLKGMGMATWGMWLGIAWFILALIALLIWGSLLAAYLAG